MSLVSFRWQPSSRELRVFAALQFVFVLCVLVRYVWEPQLAFLASTGVVVSAIVAILGLAIPKIIRPIYIVWMLAVFPIGWTISSIVLLVTYFAVLTPIGWALRLAGHDPLGRRTLSGQKTFWHARPAPPPKSRYFNQY
jgi:Saxitoxin biosynthesis operon protein SxtJ